MRRNIIKILFTSFFLFTTFACIKNPETSLVVHDSTSSHSLVYYADYYEDMKNRSFFEIRHLSDRAWKDTYKQHNHFGIGPEVIWLRIDIENNTDRQQWHIVSEYSILDTIELYHFNLDEKLIIQSEGSSIPIKKRKIKHRLPVFPIHLNSGKNRIWIKVESEFDKIVGFTLEPPEYLTKRDTLFQNPYPEFIRLGVIIAIISILCAVYLRNILFLLHFFYSASLVIFMGIWEGYAFYNVYPDNPELNNQMLHFIGFLFGFFVTQFWRRLLSLSIQLPWYNRIMSTLALISFSLSIYSLAPFANYVFLGQMARIVSFFVTIAIFTANLSVIRLGQRYALYSMLGCFFFGTSYFIFLFQGIWFITGVEYIKNPIYLGFSLELIVLILSLLSRIRFINKLRDGTPEISFAEKKSYSRIQNFDISNLVGKLEYFMKEEKKFCDENISLEGLAGLLSITRHQLSELIREVYGTNFYGFINNWRIKEAKKILLEREEETILSIAMKVGYNSKSTFNRTFKMDTGITPTQYRKLEKNRTT